MVYLLILTIIAFIAAVYFGLRLLAMKNTIKKANDELAEIMENIEENRIVKLSTPSRDVEKLLVTINALLEQIRQKAIDYKIGEKRLKKEIESISHDLRTPLTTILGYLKLIDSSKLTDEDKTSLEIVKQKAYTLQRLITQFYDLTRIDGDSYTLNMGYTDISRFLREHITANYALLSDRELNISIAIPDEPVMVNIDSNAMERVFNNLLHNAEKYAANTLSISLSASASGAEITFENDIDETGIGRNEDSTRLGLTIARLLTEKMGGNMNVEDCTKDIKQQFRVTLLFSTVQAKYTHDQKRLFP